MKKLGILLGCSILLVSFSAQAADELLRSSGLYPQDATAQEKDPLRRHAALARLRWDQATELAGLDPFSSAAVLAYAVRLVLAADLAKADEEAGLERLRKTADPPAEG